jgi:hypothetical protein
MIRIIARLFAVAVALAAFLLVAPTFAAAGSLVTFVSSTGSDGNPCTAALPCGTLAQALGAGTSGGQINCLNPTYGVVANDFNEILVASYDVTIDCPGVIETTSGAPLLIIQGTNDAVKILNLTISGANGGSSPISFTGSGTLILENCVLENFKGIALDIEPTGALNLVIKNSRISNNAAAGVLIKPAAGGSVTATFDGVTITNNAGGLKTDTTNGAVRVDISNSTINNNANNGLIAIGGAGGQNMVSVRNDVIASNSQAGIEASGGNAAVLVNNTLLDSNTAGAVSAVSGGRILTYQNNNIVGSSGTGFTGTAGPQ